MADNFFQMGKSDTRIILPARIIQDIKNKCAPPVSGIAFTNGLLLFELQSFAERNGSVYPIADTWNKVFEKGISERTLGYALVRTPQKESGANSSLREFLCCYTYQKTYAEALDKIGLTEAEVEEESARIKNSIGNRIQDKLVEKVENNHGEVVKILLRIENQIADQKYLSDRAIKERNEALKALNYIKAADLSEEIYCQKIEEFRDLKADLKQEMFRCLIALSKASRHDKIIEYSDETLAIFPDFTFVYDIKAHSLWKLNRKEEALEVAKKSLEYEPRNGDTLSFIGAMHYDFGEIEKAKASYDTIISLFLDRKLRTGTECNMRSIYGEKYIKVHRESFGNKNIYHDKWKSLVQITFMSKYLVSLDLNLEDEIFYPCMASYITLEKRIDYWIFLASSLHNWREKGPAISRPYFSKFLYYLNNLKTFKELDGMFKEKPDLKKFHVFLRRIEEADRYLK